MSKETAVTTRDEGQYLPDAESLGLFDLKANMEGVEPRLPQIKIIHQGRMFEMPDGESVKDFVGVILDMNRVNAWWEIGFDESGGGSPPQCSSLDGVRPDPLSEKRQSDDCASCPQNKFGSDGGRGKACKNMKRVHIQLLDQRLPIRLTVPPSNLKVLDEYVTMLTSKGMPYQLVRTKFSLKGVQNKDGIKYSELELSPAEYITDPEEAKWVKKQLMQYKKVMRGQEFGAEEY